MNVLGCHVFASGFLCNSSVCHWEVILDLQIIDVIASSTLNQLVNRLPIDKAFNPMVNWYVWIVD